MRIYALSHPSVFGHYFSRLSVVHSARCWGRREEKRIVLAMVGVGQGMPGLYIVITAQPGHTRHGSVCRTPQDTRDGVEVCAGDQGGHPERGMPDSVVKGESRFPGEPGTCWEQPRACA